jgi:hypothetical protein
MRTFSNGTDAIFVQAVMLISPGLGVSSQAGHRAKVVSRLHLITRGGGGGGGGRYGGTKFFVW